MYFKPGANEPCWAQKFVLLADRPAEATRVSDKSLISFDAHSFLLQARFLMMGKRKKKEKAQFGSLLEEFQLRARIFESKLEFLRLKWRKSKKAKPKKIKKTMMMKNRNNN